MSTLLDTFFKLFKRNNISDHLYLSSIKLPLMISCCFVMSVPFAAFSQNAYNLGETIEATATILNDDSPLQVEWLSFSGQIKNHQSHLKWKLASEYNVNQYIIEWKPKGKDWAKLNSITAQNNGTRADYQFVHHYPDNGINYYRIQQEDNDGTFSFSEVISLFYEKDSTKDLIFYPNPTEAEFHINLPVDFDKKEACTLRVYDVIGELVWAKQWFSGEVVDLSHLAKNMYRVEVVQKDIRKTATLVLQ